MKNDKSLNMNGMLLKKLAGKTAGAIPGVMNGDAESLHQLRVNLRRLRNALWLYKDVIPSKQLRRWDKNLRKVADRTSAGRDLDVLIDFLKGGKAHIRDKEQARYYDVMIAVLMKRRERIQASLVKAMPQKKFRSVLAEIKGCFKPKSFGGKQDPYRRAWKRIYKRTRDLLDYGVIAGSPEKTDDLHQMRIAAKHLRYTLEALHPLFDERMEQFVHEVLFFHRHLGAIHDYDVWLEEIRSLEDKLSGTQGCPREFWEGLRAGIRQQRAVTYNQFFKAWKRAEDSRVFEKLCEYVLAWTGGV